jgi:phosphoribosylformylglycinamidine (FGAM) synthase-like enzyme
MPPSSKERSIPFRNYLEDNILAGHDIGSGGLITTLLEMCFADNNLGAK